MDDVVDGVVDKVGDVVLPGPVKEALEKVWDFLEGCASFVGDTFGSIKDVATQFGQLVTNGPAFIRDKLDVAKSLHDGIRADPGGFSTEFLGDAVELDLLESNPAQWAGKVGCELAVAILTGGAAASGRFANLLGDASRFANRVRDWIRRRDSDRNGADCPASSFPTGTQVQLADGYRRPIEAIRPGDTVWAFDSAAGTWSPRAVLAQWSYLDTDEMATLRLADGSTVSATDHHRFWSASQGAFDELEDLATGEQLVTPQGQVLVESVTTWRSRPTLVWELTVAVHHTFAVFAGDHAIAVHNEDCVPLVNGRRPINSQYAGRVYDGPGWTDELRTKYPAGVRFNDRGFPDFSQYSKQTAVSEKLLTGDVNTDLKSLGLPPAPDGYTWYHVEDGHTMHLVPTEIHQAVRHTGGAAVVREMNKEMSKSEASEARP